MKSNEHDIAKKEIMVLSHEPWPGFKKVFWIVFTLSCLYLGTILYSSLPEVLNKVAH